MSSNKILGLFGQDFPIPLVGHPTMEDVWDLADTIVIIVSHSGGTFAPLACSNLMKAKTNKIFVVASEWDTQVGKQLRKLSAGVGTFDSRIFSTDVGVRPAEPCTISVVATQNLLTLIFEHICLVILSDKQFRFATGARITDSDLSQLERCNQDNLRALEGLVGYNAAGKPLNPKGRGAKHAELRAAGAYWSLHVLEGVYAWIMSAVYVFGTVTAGYPAVTGIATVAGSARGLLHHALLRRRHLRLPAPDLHHDPAVVARAPAPAPHDGSNRGHRGLPVGGAVRGGAPLEALRVQLQRRRDRGHLGEPGGPPRSQTHAQGRARRAHGVRASRWAS